MPGTNKTTAAPTNQTEPVTRARNRSDDAERKEHGALHRPAAHMAPSPLAP